MLAHAIQAKDVTAAAMSSAVQHYASSLARRVGLPDMDAQAVETAALCTISASLPSPSTFSPSQVH